VFLFYIHVFVRRLGRSSVTLLGAKCYKIVLSNAADAIAVDQSAACFSASIPLCLLPFFASLGIDATDSKPLSPNQCTELEGAALVVDFLVTRTFLRQNEFNAIFT